MRYLELQKAVETNLFTLADVKKHFPEESDGGVKMQLSRFKKRGLIFSLKRGIYCFDPQKIDELQLANKLYRPSYVSMETALRFYGMIPDVPQEVVSVNPLTLRKFQTDFGRFVYHKIKKELFWGYRKLSHGERRGHFLIAEKEKALLDYFYLRKIKVTADLRLELSEIDFQLYQEYAKHFPAWVRKIKLKK
jgi:predicted transcriptional regulator of viral defense system